MRCCAARIHPRRSQKAGQTRCKTSPPVRPCDPLPNHSEPVVAILAIGARELPYQEPPSLAGEVLQCPKGVKPGLPAARSRSPLTVPEQTCSASTRTSVGATSKYAFGRAIRLDLRDRGGGSKAFADLRIAEKRGSKAREISSVPNQERQPAVPRASAIVTGGSGRHLSQSSGIAAGCTPAEKRPETSVAVDRHDRDSPFRHD